MKREQENIYERIEKLKNELELSPKEKERISGYTRAGQDLQSRLEKYGKEGGK